MTQNFKKCLLNKFKRFSEDFTTASAARLYKTSISSILKCTHAHFTKRYCACLKSLRRTCSAAMNHLNFVYNNNKHKNLN